MDASSPKPPPAEAGPVEVEPLDLKGRRRKGKGAGRSDALATGERGRVSVTQANPLALSRQEMGILSKRLLVLALSDVTRDDSGIGRQARFVVEAGRPGASRIG